MATFNTPFGAPQKSANKKELFITLGIVAALVVGTLGYYFWPKSSSPTNETPPSITISTPKFQGLISGDIVCQIPGMYEFTDSAVSGYKMPGTDGDPNWNNLEQGIHMYHSIQPIHVKEIVDAIKPVAGNKIMIAYYPSDDGNISKKFAIYPELPEQTKITDPASYLIPGDQGFAIFSCKDTKIWQVKTEKMTNKDISGLLNSKTKGWILLAATDQPLSTSLAPYKNKIKSVWLQKDAGFEFQKAANLESATLVGDYKMVWLKVGEEEGGEKPKSTDVKVFLAPKTADKTVNGGDTIELATFTLFSESKASIKKITLRQNGNINANYIDNIELLSSKSIEQGLLKDLTPVTHKLEKVDTKSFALNFDPNTIVLDNSYLYLQIKTKTPSESEFGGATYNIGLEKVSDVQLYETDRAVVPFNNDFKTPAYGNIYTIATSTKLGKPKNFVVDTQAPQTNSTTIKVKWELPEGTKAVDIKSYHFKYGTGTQVGSNIVKDQTDLSGNSTFALAQNLTPNTDYWFSIAAIDLKGVEGEAATITGKTAQSPADPLLTCNSTCYTACVQPPASEAYECPKLPAPKNLIVSEKTSTSIKITWAAPVDSKFIANYNVEYSPGAILDNKPETNRTINNLNPNTTYYFIVKAIDNNGKIGDQTSIQGQTNVQATSAPTKPTFNYTFKNSTYVYWTQPNTKLDSLKGKYKITYIKYGCAANGMEKSFDVKAWDAGDSSTAAANDYKWVINATYGAEDLIPATKYGVTISGSNDDGKTWSAESECAEFTTMPDPVIEITSCQYDPTNNYSGIINFKFTTEKKDYNYKLEYKYNNNGEKSSTIDIHPESYTGNYTENNYAPFAEIIGTGEVALYNLSGYPSKLRMLPSSGNVNHDPTDWCNLN